MEFLKKGELFSLKLDGVSAFDYLYTERCEEKNGALIREYCFEDQIKITNTARKIEGFQAYEWVNRIENISDEPSRLITELWDADITVPWAHEDERQKTPWQSERAPKTFIHTTRGSMSGPIDFSDEPRAILPGLNRQFNSAGGRSTDGFAPYFNINNGEGGVIVALGWTGQWRASFDQTTDSLRIRAKIEDTCFKVLPSESFRTLSATVLFYDGDVTDGQNLWRRLMKKEYSPTIVRSGNLPICANFWGGLESGEVIDRVKIYKENGVPFTYMWMDAGWGGAETLPTFDEFTGDWYSRVGDWRISRHVHPMGLCDVAKVIRDSGYGFVLWFEPERARENTDIVKSHPEYFLSDGGSNRLLNLGDPEAYAYIKQTIFGIIRELGVTCYRQDFNFSPLPFWRANDAEDRQGITEIKHINALYRYYDEMLAEFPELIIDNCASGGRRLDLEMMKRSFPLWRSDAQCPADPTPEVTQVNNVNFSRWLPYTATGSGRVYDTYLMRSSYSSGMATNFGFSKHDVFWDDPEKLAWIKKSVEELHSIRKYFGGDLYQLTEVTTDATAWSITEWNIPEECEGMIQIFKRERSPYDTATIRLRGIDGCATYSVTDLDGGSFEVSGAELAGGLSISIAETRVAKIFVYKKI